VILSALSTKISSLTEDLTLDKNGSPVTFSRELAERVATYQNRSVTFNLLQDALLIGCGKDQPVDAAMCAVSSVLKHSSITWDTHRFSATDTSDGRPVAFSALKPWAIVTAARKAGVFPRQPQRRITAVRSSGDVPGAVSPAGPGKNRHGRRMRMTHLLLPLIAGLVLTDPLARTKT